ncbi:MAG TPA: hypothetical protein VIS05_03365, partial [Ilumatobacter sp.]
RPGPAAAEPAPAAAPPAVEAVRPSAVSVPDAWEHTVKSQVKPLVRALYSVGSFTGHQGDTWQFAVPNEAHGAKCNEHRPAVEAALAAAVGGPIRIEFVVTSRPHDDPEATPAPGRTASPAPREAAPARPPADPSGTASHQPAADDEIDLSDLTDAPPESVKTPIDRLAEAFPGSELMADD